MRARNDLMVHQKLYFGPGRIFLALGLCLILSASSLAQKTAIYENEASGYRMGMELFEKGKFGAAQHEFKKIAESSDPNSDSIKSDVSLILNVADVKNIRGTFLYTFPFRNS